MILQALRRRLVALVAVAGIATAGMPSVFAMSAVAAKGAGQSPTTQAPAAVLDLQKLGEQAVELQRSMIPRIAARGRRMQLRLDILTAATPAERHRLVRQLPVTIIRSAATNRSSANLIRFVARGKTRLQLTTPATPALGMPLPQVEQPSGPSATSLRDDCYGGEPEPCATWEEMDDLGIYIADAEAENDSAQSDYDTSYADYEAYCSENPWACDEGAGPALLPTHGPSVSPDDLGKLAGCGDQAVTAVEHVGASAAALLAAHAAYAGAAATSVALPVAAVASIYIGVGVLGFATGWFVAAYIDCVVHRVAGTEAQSVYWPEESY